MERSKNGWDRYREYHLERLRKALENGEVDRAAIPVLDVINASPDYVTTSSCSGRMVLIETLPDERKIESAFYRKWHGFPSPEEVWKALEGYPGGKVLWFKYEPLIFHVAARDLEKAMALIKAARLAGIKVAGIQQVDSVKNHLEIRGIDYMATPVFDGKVLVTREYCHYLVTTALRKHKKNLARLKKLEKEIKRAIGVF